MPVYYADLAAYRGRCLLYSDEGSDDGSGSSASFSGAGASLSVVKFAQVEDKMSKLMHFC